MRELLMLLIILAVYFVPTVVAIKREHHNLAAIIALNVLLGWTLLGWIAALVWALTAVKGRESRVEQ